ncbi:MAG: methylenetetrahydrofolate reductase C-terminal domain-containing protein [Candidatus Rokubacteria bacterium]|nr:methylenetetrahydrofolate reductase C-terminal domain-containing protein [Candidatus Rokubacteria bacterium]
MTNPLREALATGRFCYVVELVASALKREAQVLDVASRLAGISAVVAGSVTSYAGGAIGHDPIRVGTAARARGLTPNIHLTCVSQDRRALGKTLEDLHALGIENVFALTGDYPTATEPSAAPPVFDLDSVQLVRLIDERRRGGVPFHVAVAVSPFKYVEADAIYQYVKLEKKIAAGADLAITQVGWDAEKFRELKRYLDERGLRTPVLGNVYVLSLRAAERMATGQPPGCWVAPALLGAVRAEQAAPDRGRRARLERAAQTVAVLRGLGYAGAYIGGTHEADQIEWIIRRAEELRPDWERLADGLSFGAPGGFYLHPATPSPPTRPRGAGGPKGEGRGAGHPTALPGHLHPGPLPGRERAMGRPPIAVRVLDLMGRFFPVTRDTWLRRALARASAWIDRRPWLARLVERAELALKRPAFGCQACGNCVLGSMEYVCPQTCPKQMRNGPCGGTHLGRCEVVDRPCIWVSVYERAQAAGRLDSLRLYVPPPDRTLQGTSSWINYFLERDRRPRG